MMVSEFFSFIARLLHLEAAVLIPLLPMTLILVFLAKLFQALVLRGSPLTLTAVGIVLVIITNGFWNDGQYALSAMPLVPLVFVGREMYQRLLLE